MNPLNQFYVSKIKALSLFNLDLSITNAFISFMISYLLIFILCYVSTIKLQLKASRIQMCGELIYLIIYNMLNEISGRKSIKFVSFVCTLFLFILINNIIAIFPLFFSTTSHISVTLCLSIISFMLVLATGFIKNGIGYFSILLPKGTIISLAPLMIFIELFAFMIRPFSLAIRLAANISAGHIVLKILASFILISKIFGIFPFILLTILTAFEIIVAMLQAYIFVMLTSVYLGEALNLH